MDIKQAFLDGHKIRKTSWNKQEFILLDKKGRVKDEGNKNWITKEAILEHISCETNWELFQEPVKIHNLWI